MGCVAPQALPLGTGVAGPPAADRPRGPRRVGWDRRPSHDPTPTWWLVFVAFGQGIEHLIRGALTGDDLFDV